MKLSTLKFLFKRLWYEIYMLFYTIVDYPLAYFYRLFPYRYFVKDLLYGYGEGKGERRILCLFAHYHRASLILEDVVYYLKHLHEQGCEIIFLSNSKRLINSELEKIKPYVRLIIHRRGRGVDFGSWYVGWKYVKEHLNLGDYELLLLVNDSVYGPIFSLDKLFKFIQESNYDVVGVTSSLEVKYHLQSYFLAFKRDVFNSSYFHKFWKRYRFFQKKRAVVKKYEVGLSQYLLKVGYRVGAYCEYIDLLRFVTKRHHSYQHILYHPVNPTHHLWDLLIEKMECPFLKKELILINPSRIPNVNQWPTIISKYNSLLKDIILEHIKYARLRER